MMKARPAKARLQAVLGSWAANKGAGPSEACVFLPPTLSFATEDVL